MRCRRAGSSLSSFTVFGSWALVAGLRGALPGVFGVPAGIGDTLTGLFAVPAAIAVATGTAQGRRPADGARGIRTVGPRLPQVVNLHVEE